jgi:hypothetical protein
MIVMVAAILVSPKQYLCGIALQHTTLATQLLTSARQRVVIALALLRFWAMIVVLLCLSTIFYRYKYRYYQCTAIVPHQSVVNNLVVMLCYTSAKLLV